MTAILGISAFYHDSAAALVVDGDIAAAAQEERFTRKKHDSRFPGNAAAYCLAEAELTAADVDYIAFYEKPLTRFERLLETYLAFAPRGLRSFREAIPLWIRERLYHRRQIREGVPGADRARLVFLEHHESHAASAFFPSPFDEAAILTMDGVGEWATTTWGIGRGATLSIEEQIRFPHSLGLLYSAFTAYCGFRVNSGEYKLMGLAPYGEPRFRQEILDHLIDLKPDGSFHLNLDYFDFCTGLRMTNTAFDRLFGGPPRSPEDRIEQRHMDLAASIQRVTEEAVLGLARRVHNQTKQKHLVLAGGVALNCVANGKLLRDGPFERIWIQPAAGDAGGALGAALFTWHQLLKKPRTPQPGDSQKGSLLGPRFSSAEITQFLDRVGASYELLSDDNALLERVTAGLSAGRICGWFQGRMEFGPRALGSRSILGDPRHPEMQSRLNRKIKFRESFRPFAPSVLETRAADWFDVPHGHPSPYMLLTAPVREERQRSIPEPELRRMQESPDLAERVNIVRSEIPCVTHVDNSARLQTVSLDSSPRFHALLSRFHERTGCPVLANTSFNVRGEPIVCTPEDAWRAFRATNMDFLVLENCLLDKTRQPPLSDAERDAHLRQFAPD